MSEDNVDVSYNNVGGVAREAFDKRWLSPGIVYEGRSKQRSCKASLTLVTMNLSPKAAGDKLFTIFPRDGYRVYDVMWVSLDARDMTIEALKKKYFLCPISLGRYVYTSPCPCPMPSAMIFSKSSTIF